MRTEISINDFNQELKCIYKSERYSARDNGAVLKHPQAGKRKRPTDDEWTFGLPNIKTGYMEIASVRVHRIIATAFHGEPPTKDHVVDHIDTNRRNNRPENLRWVTRLENVLFNPITVRRIELACGCSVEEFLADPSKFRDKFMEPKYNWMCTVSPEEGQSSLQRMLFWAKSEKMPSGGSLREWIYYRNTFQSEQTQETIKSKTVNAAQRNWGVPSKFPCCPQEFKDDPIKTYAGNLKDGLVFCQNDYYYSLVSKCAISDDSKKIYVLSESKGLKPWALAKINYEKGIFIHTSLGTFFSKEGAEKCYCDELGLDWTGGDTFDDFA